MPYAAYVFDFDYTLGDATEGIVQCVQHALACMDVALCSREEIRRTVGHTLPDTFALLTGCRDRDQAQTFLRLFTEKADQVMTRNTSLFPDTVPTLCALRERGARIGVVTTKYHYRIDEILARFGITDLVDCVVGLEDVRRPKPDPEGLLLALETLGTPRDKALYVGDSTVDAGTAQRAGVDFIAVATGATPPDAFLAFPNRMVAASLSAILEGVEGFA